MKRIILGLAVLALLVVSTSAKAQNATFTWSGDATNYVEMATIDGQPVNQAGGYAGALSVNNNPLMTLPQSLGFPNNGYLDSCAGYSYTGDVWTIGTAANPQNGDAFTRSAYTTCDVGQTVAINVKESWVVHVYAGRYGRKVVSYQMIGGSGTAMVR